MKPTSTIALVLLASGSACFAEKAAELKPLQATIGKLVVDESFKEPLGKNWNIAKGDWQVEDGALVGKEKPADKHPGVLMLVQPNKNSVIRFSLKLDGSEGFSLSLNKETGHLFRVNVSASSIAIAKDREKTDPKAKGGNLAEAKVAFEKGEWHTLMLEIDGPKVSLQTDNGAKLTASDPDLDVAKTGYRFVTKGAAVMVDDLKVWDVVP